MTTTNLYTLPELLAPAGNLEKCRTALLYGANAVYLGGTAFNLRAATDGFTPVDLSTAVTEAEQQGSRIFYTLNVMPMQRDMALLPAVIEQAAQCGVHAFIVADPGVLRLVQKYAPKHEIHLSTQANTTNVESISFWLAQGVARVNLARELTCRDIFAIRQQLPQAELEVFVHGAMCLAISGQCLLSAWLNKRHANLGRCTQPCRFEYKSLGIEAAPKGCLACQETVLTVSEQTRPDQPLWSVTEQEAYSSFWAPYDLCLIKFLPWFIRNKITALKIEGRMKGASYVAHVVDTYATALRHAQECLVTRKHFSPDWYWAELYNTASRPLSTGFFIPDERMVYTAAQEKLLPHPLLAKVEEPIDENSGLWKIAVRGHWNASQTIELMLPGLSRPQIKPINYSLETLDKNKISVVNSGTFALLHVESNQMQPGIFIRGIPD